MFLVSYNNKEFEDITRRRGGAGPFLNFVDAPEVKHINHRLSDIIMMMLLFALFMLMQEEPCILTAVLTRSHFYLLTLHSV